MAILADQYGLQPQLRVIPHLRADALSGNEKNSGRVGCRVDQDYIEVNPLAGTGSNAERLDREEKGRDLAAITERTVKAHRQNVMEKLRAHSLLKFVLVADCLDVLSRSDRDAMLERSLKEANEEAGTAR